MNNHLRFILSGIAFFFSGFLSLKAQCISTFPYHENFEITNGSWTSGGVSNDWAWGTPSKPVISSAGQGLKCWIVGGLTNSSYANGERSYVTSPCFDFTNLAHPYIEFKIFWESERKYDGSNLQYSINNGTSWINVGTVNEPTDCYTANWYNYTPVVYLTNLATAKDGWSGNMQATAGSCQGGGGSSGWVVAKHCLSFLAGQSNVLFRFTFGAGTTCNAFDGVAFDDVYIQNAPRYTADFGFNCTSTATFSFSDSSTNCPSSWHWNFGDVASGVNNTSTVQNPTHIFSSPGVYHVQLVATNACSGNDTITKSIAVLGLSIDSLNVSCPNGNNGQANAIVTGSNAPLSYSWNTTPPQLTDSAFQLVAGIYTITVSQQKTCSVSRSVHITQPANFSHSFSTTSSVCGSANGSGTVTENGGTPNYNYQWQPNVSSSNIANNINAGNYVVSIIDQNGCTDSIHVYVPSSGGSMTLGIINLKNVSCYNGNDGGATVQVNGGTPGFNYSWTPNVSNSNSSASLSANNYSVIVTDANNCTAQIQFNIHQPSALQLHNQLTNTTCGKKNGLASVQVNGGISPYSYNWQPNISSSNSANNLISGTYLVQVIDSHNCVINDTLSIKPSIPLKFSIITKPDTCNSSKGEDSISINSGTPPYQYHWLPFNSYSPTINHIAYQTQVTAIVTDSNQCKDTMQAVTPSFGMMNVNLGADTTICDGFDKIILSVSNFNFIKWQDGSSNNTFMVTRAGEYSVTVKNNYGCAATDSINVSEHCVEVLQVPNAFSPNGDGYNDDFGAITNHPDDLRFYKIAVYNRWGEQIFASSNYHNRWDGKFEGAEQPLSVYVYMIEYSFSEQSSHQLLKGDVTLIR